MCAHVYFPMNHSYTHLLNLFRGRSRLKRGRPGLSGPHEDEGEGRGEEVAEEGQDTGHVSVGPFGFKSVEVVCYISKI